MHIHSRYYKTINSSPFVYLYKSISSNNSQLVTRINATSLKINNKGSFPNNSYNIACTMVEYSETYFDNDEDHTKGVWFDYIAIGRWK